MLIQGKIYFWKFSPSRPKHSKENRAAKKIPRVLYMRNTAAFDKIKIKKIFMTTTEINAGENGTNGKSCRKRPTETI